jgi:hypothetical protein
MTPAIAHDHKYLFFSLVTVCGLHATTASDNRAALASRQSRPSKRAAGPEQLRG